MDTTLLYGLLQIVVIAVLGIGLAVTLVQVWRRRQRERWLKQDLLNSVYNARERRVRGD